MSRVARPDLQPSASSAATDASLLPSQASALLGCFTNFLTVALHSILYHRKLYPEATFLTARAYNLPVHQSRHPGVCAWIRDAVAAVGAQVRVGSARQVSLVIHAPASFDVVERWIFDLQSFPATWGDKDTSSGPPLDPATADEAVNWTDVNEALRGALSRIAHVGQSRPRLPDGCTFTIGIELRDQALPPIQHPQLWIPAQPHLQTASESRPELGRALGGTATAPIRSVRAGPLFFECWVEQGKLASSTASPEAPSFSPASDNRRGTGPPDTTASSSS
ncbi:REV7-like protein [Metarhizium album ARSEF 1941]|uniref:REV7-like protein n=1 Tax=Metarhizium album (strain ARSEF 1941) TaxID=1081103 RepID=A0A0B2WJD8_METAS|nr:REV7-like protein [Metarhizium album ARSEF 1941]KHN93779.1 REV7-like protein [Metarhizium album ARSEF 1941]